MLMSLLRKSGKGEGSKRLLVRLRENNWMQFCREEGMDPEKRLSERSRDSKEAQLEKNWSGTAPEKLLLERSRKSKRGPEEQAEQLLSKVGGSPSLIRLWERSR